MFFAPPNLIIDGHLDLAWNAVQWGLDLTYCSDAAFWEALEQYDGPVLCSHHNCRALMLNQRQLADEQIRAAAERGGVSSHPAALGSDLDGGFGREQSPGDLDTSADLQRIGGLLAARGYADDDVAAIMHGNWLRLLRELWGAYPTL